MNLHPESLRDLRYAARFAIHKNADGRYWIEAFRLSVERSHLFTVKDGRPIANEDGELVTFASAHEAKYFTLEWDDYRFDYDRPTQPVHSARKRVVEVPAADRYRSNADNVRPITGFRRQTPVKQEESECE